jgi:hypothetical protein
VAKGYILTIYAAMVVPTGSVVRDVAATVNDVDVYAGRRETLENVPPEQFMLASVPPEQTMFVKLPEETMGEKRDGETRLPSRIVTLLPDLGVIRSV